MLDSLFRYAKFQYECGNYSAASLCLDYYRNIIPQQNPNYLSALYGKLASEILLQVSIYELIKIRKDNVFNRNSRRAIALVSWLFRAEFYQRC